MMGERAESCYEPSAFQDRRAIVRSYEAVMRSLEMLQRYPKPDTFLGRKTHESFPKQNEE